MEKLKTLILTKTELWVKLALILLFLMFFLLCIVFTGKLGAQTTVTIGTGTNTQSQPFNALYGYGRSASIYTSAQVTTFGTITHLGWYVATSQATSIPVKIYVKQTTAANLTADTWANMITGATLVYDANVSFSTTGWFTIDISDFNYSANNLLVLCEANYSGTGTSSYPLFRYSNTTTKQMSYSQDNTPPTGNGTVGNSRPNIQVTISTCTLTGGTATATDADISSGQNTTINCTGHTSSGTLLQWEQSADGTTGWANVSGGSGATTASYITPNLSETVYYRLKVVDSGNASCFTYSTVACVTVTCGLSGGTATATDTEIYMGAFTDISCTGYTVAGTTLQWQQSSNGTSGWTDVNGGSGSTTDNYTTPSLSATTYYRLVINDGNCSSYSNVVCITTVCGVTVGGTSTAVDSPIPTGTTTTINCIGYSALATNFQWQQSENGTSGWVNVIGGIGANTDSYVTDGLLTKTYYRLVVSDSYCQAISTVDEVDVVISNDECANATDLSVNDACFISTITNIGATASTGIPAPGCGGTVFQDIWFKFVVPASGQVEISTQAGVITDVAMAIYSGSCGSLTLIECDDDDGDGNMSWINRSGLSIGDTLFLRIWEYGGGGFGTFGVCISVPAPIASDECSGATELTVSSVCQYYTFDNTGATVSSGVSNPSCGTSNQYFDVWFKCVIPQSGNIRISTEEIVGSALVDCAIAVYSGTCGSLTQIDCNNDYVTGHYYMPFLDIYGRTEGEIIFIRFWDIVTSGKSTAKDEGVCKICAYELPDIPSCISTIVPEDICVDAPIISSLDGYCGNTSSSYTVDDPGNLLSLFCGSIENNSWLSFVAAEETAQINIYVSDCYSGSHSWPNPTSGVQMRVYGTSDCNTFTAYSNCWFPARPVNGFLTAEGLTVGNTYYLMIDGVYGDDCDYKIGAAEGTVLLPVEFTSASAVCKGDMVEISWQTATEKNCDYYSVEKSYDAVSFIPIMSLPGAGNSAVKSDYYYNDYEVSDVRTYYRIKQTDFDGKFSYSELFTVNCFEYSKSDITIYPNPFNTSFCVDFTSCEKQPVKIEICSLSGTLLLSRLVESNEKTQECFNLDDTFSPGYFLLKVFFDDDIQVLKLVKI